MLLPKMGPEGAPAYGSSTSSTDNGLATQENLHEDHRISPRRPVGSGRDRRPSQRLRCEELLCAAGSNTELTASSRSAVALAAALSLQPMRATSPLIVGRWVHLPFRSKMRTPVHATTRRMTMRTMLSAMLAPSVLAAVAAPAATPRSSSHKSWRTGCRAGASDTLHALD